MSISQERQAGAAGAASLNAERSCNSDSLRFDTQDDALNFARKAAEDGWRWARERGFSLVNDYLQGNSEIDLHFATNTDAGKFEFVAAVIPYVVAERDRGDQVETASTKVRGEEFSEIAERYTNDALVFVGAGQAKEAVEFLVPSKSVVRFEAKDKGDEVGMDILATISGLIPEITGRATDWKVNTFGIWATESDCAIADGLIQRMSEFVDDSVCVEPEVSGDSLLETKANDFLSGLRILAFDDAIMTFSEERITCRFELTDAFFRAVD